MIVSRHHQHTSKVLTFFYTILDALSVVCQGKKMFFQRLIVNHKILEKEFSSTRKRVSRKSSSH
jgi:hypothetical protein